MMATASQKLTDKIAEIYEELHRTANGERTAPEWVYRYGRTTENEPAFDEWLQFVYLPNLLKKLQRREVIERQQNLAPQAVCFFGEGLQKGRLLQLLIELDSLL